MSPSQIDTQFPDSTWNQSFKPFSARPRNFSVSAPREVTRMVSYLRLLDHCYCASPHSDPNHYNSQKSSTKILDYPYLLRPHRRAFGASHIVCFNYFQVVAFPDCRDQKGQAPARPPRPAPLESPPSDTASREGSWRKDAHSTNLVELLSPHSNNLQHQKSLK